MKTNSSPDSLPEYKYPYLQNIRNYKDSSTSSRPQITQTQAAPASPGPILSLEPTIGVYKIGSAIYVNGVQVDTGYAAGLGASLCPFRPNSSPNAYEYVFDQNKASKVFVPSSGSPVVQKAGIAEPQNPPDAVPDHFNVFPIEGLAATFTNGGTAGALSDFTRVTDTAVAFFLDPASVSPVLAPRYSMQVGTGVTYSKGQGLNIVNSAGGHASVIVQDVLPPVNTQSTLTILSIFYFSSILGLHTGRCIIVPSQTAINAIAPNFTGTTPIGDSINSMQLISTLRRGSLVQIGTGLQQETVIVLSVINGPQNTIAFECSTTKTHVAAEVITGLPAVSVSFTEPPANLTGQAISHAGIQETNAAGLGSITKVITGATNPFINQGFASDPLLATPQDSDYVHVSLNIADITKLTRIRIAFDVNNGAADFTSNVFYFDIRPNDLSGAVSGTQSQLAAAQQALQRVVIDQSLSGNSFTSFNPGADLSNAADNIPVATDINTSGQTALGTSQWSEVMFPISSMTRVGNDQTRTLANVQSMQIQITTTDNVLIQVDSIWVSSGGQPDVGDSGFLYFYRVRPRNSVTGVIGNPSPSMRYGVGPRRQRVIVALPNALFDQQIDTWDIFRIGGSITEWRLVGSSPSSATSYVDNVFDTAITNNELLSFEEFEPFPSIGPPVSTSLATVSGTVMTATFPTARNNPIAFGTLSQMLNLLPGNLFNIGPNVFTLYKRPLLFSSGAGIQTIQFEFQENAGNQTNPLVIIQEPNLAAQATNRVFGPDTNGSFFAIQAGMANNQGLGLRAGLIQWTNPNNPDSASDKNTKDLCPPAEPLQNGIILAGQPVVFSSKRAWQGYFQPDGGYSFTEIPVSRGLAAEFGICTDGAIVYAVTVDGIRAGSAGTQSLTDGDLYNLFPHEGVYPQDVTYAGQTVFAPEFKFASNIRLACVNGYLYFDYIDSLQNQRTLVCDLRKIAWSVDVYSPNPATIHMGVTEPSSNQKVPASASRNNQLFIGDTTGAIYIEQSSPSMNSGEIVSCVVATREEMVGDIRGNKKFGDVALDCLPASSLTVTPVFLGTPFATSTVIAASVSRPQSPPTINLLGEQLQRSIGLLISWTDQGVNSTLFSWQPSYITEPEDISNRNTDWDNAGSDANKWWQGFQIECDTNNQVKSLTVRDADNLLTHAFTSDNSALAVNQIRANGQQVITCSFPVPFRAHLARIEPDNTVWRLYRVLWIVEATPEAAMNWINQPTSHGLPGYQHVKQFLFPYNAPAPVTITVTIDGTATTPPALPATTGYQKALVLMPPNKGLVFQYSATSTQPFQVWVEDFEVFVKSWGDSGPYRNIKMVGGSMSPRASI